MSVLLRTSVSRTQKAHQKPPTLGHVPHRLKVSLAQLYSLHNVGTAYYRRTGCSETMYKKKWFQHTPRSAQRTRRQWGLYKFMAIERR
ncbi:hypothetical protein WG66_002622 [Moniliophthora roreri]|nr:hypothetical protein WG66_002622 [Moniliophthora roreri]